MELYQQTVVTTIEIYVTLMRPVWNRRMETMSVCVMKAISVSYPLLKLVTSTMFWFNVALLLADLGPGDRCVEADCTGHSDCDENARCEYYRAQSKYTCRCNEGYQGDGFTCSSQSQYTDSLL